MEFLRKNWLLLVSGVLLGAGAGIFILAALGVAIPGFPGSGISGEIYLAPETNMRALIFQLEDLEGSQVSLADFQGRTVILNFWATWCGPCKEEMPLLQSYADRYAKDLVVVGVDYDEPRETVQAYVDDLGLTFPILLDPGGKIGNQYRVRGFPSTFLLDAEGIIRYQHIGPLTEAQLQAYLANFGVGE